MPIRNEQLKFNDYKNKRLVKIIIRINYQLYKHLKETSNWSPQVHLIKKQ